MALTPPRDPRAVMRKRARDLGREMMHAAGIDLSPQGLPLLRPDFPGGSSELLFNMVVETNVEMAGWLDRLPADDVIQIFIPVFKVCLIALARVEQWQIESTGLYSSYVANLLPQLKRDLEEIACESEETSFVRESAIKTDFSFLIAAQKR